MEQQSAGFVTYGSTGGIRAAEALRLVMGELRVADVRSGVALNILTDFENFTTLTPSPIHDRSLDSMFDQVLAWAAALALLRAAG